MIFHTINTMTIGRFADIERSGNLKLVMRYRLWVPKWYLIEVKRRITTDYNKIGNENNIRKLISSDVHRLKMINKINILYPTLLELKKLTDKYDDKEIEELFINCYESLYNKKPSTENDYKKIEKDHSLIARKFAQLTEINKSEDNKIDFNQLLLNTELILSPMTIRDKYLSELPSIFELASKKIKGNG